MKLNRYTVQKIALTLSIFIVLNLLFNYAIFAFYTSPDYDDFCGKETRQYYDNKDSCEAIGGEWVAYEQGPYSRPMTSVNEFGEELGIVTDEDVLEAIAGREIIDEEDEHVSLRDKAAQQWKKSQAEDSGHTDTETEES